MRSPWVCGCLAVMVVLLSFASRNQAEDRPGTPPAPTGILTGRVNLWPASPVGRQGIKPAQPPAPGVKLIIYGPPRLKVATVVTDAAGKFRVSLPAGKYLVEMIPVKGREFTKDLPATVTITPGRETRLNILLDTGLR